jgi:hypothetical protein
LERIAAGATEDLRAQTGCEIFHCDIGSHDDLAFARDRFRIARPAGE